MLMSVFCVFVEEGKDFSNYLSNGVKSTLLDKNIMSPNLVICEPNSKKVCGNEAVCMLLNATTHYCMCIHTSEPMTLKGKCSIKKVEVKPSKIYDLTMPQNGHKLITINNATNSSFKAATKDSVTTLANSFGVPVSFSPIAIFLSSSLVLIVALFLLWKTMCHRFGFKRKKNDKNKAFAIQLEKNILVEERYTTNPQYTSAGATTDVSVGLVPILSRNSITDLQKIGEGFFGKVYRGQLHTVDNGEEHVETVAVKMLKQTANLEAEEDFMREVEIMSSFHHPNILILIGVCPREHLNPPWMIFEFMPFGDLADVLRNSSHLFWKSVPALPTLSPEALLSISSQIANGMEYLAAQRFVHRDLACRNCLVGSTLTVKISDFGMSRDVYTCDYYKIGGTRMLPVRWMSPESILYGKFTLESDVWSYGVVLWEIYNYGKQPYFGHTNEEVLKFILEGIVLDTPENCPNEIAEIMKLCWRKDPKERIQFLDICNRLSKLKENLSRHDVPCLPRPPPVPVTIDYPILFEDEPEDNLDEDNYLRPKSPPSNSLLNGYVETLP